MTDKRNPVALAADHAPNSFCLAAQGSVDTRALLDFQAKLLARRCRFVPPTARLVGSLASGETRV
jgi:hypothetical protein